MSPKPKQFPIKLDPVRGDSIWRARTSRHKTSPFLTWVDGKDIPANAVRKPLRVLERYRKMPQLDPNLLIFHVGRCGSTLLTEVLRLDRRNFVLSEPQATSDWHHGQFAKRFGRAEGLEVFRALLRSYSAARHESEEKTIFKFSTYNNFGFRSYVEAFPDCPRIFVHRDPFEVLLSYLKSPVPYLDELYRVFAPDGGAPAQPGYLWFLVHHVKSLYEAVDPHLGADTLILDYRQLNLEGFRAIYRYLGYAWSPKVEERVRDRLRYYSKTKQKNQLYKGDAVPEELRRLLKRESPMIRKTLLPFYEDFEARRLGSPLLSFSRQ